MDVNGYYAHHDHDDRYAPRVDLIEVTSTEFLPSSTYFGGDPAWNYEGYWFTNAADAGCLVAPVDLPAGRPLTSAKLRYAAFEAVSVHVELNIQNIAPGPFTDDQDARALSETFEFDQTPDGLIVETDLELPTEAIVGAAGSDVYVAVCSNDVGAVVASLALGFD